MPIFVQVILYIFVYLFGVGIGMIVNAIRRKNRNVGYLSVIETREEGTYLSLDLDKEINDFKDEPWIIVKIKKQRI